MPGSASGVRQLLVRAGRFDAWFDAPDSTLWGGGGWCICARVPVPHIRHIKRPKASNFGYKRPTGPNGCTCVDPWPVEVCANHERTILVEVHAPACAGRCLKAMYFAPCAPGQCIEPRIDRRAGRYWNPFRLTHPSSYLRSIPPGAHDAVLHGIEFFEPDVKLEFMLPHIQSPSGLPASIKTSTAGIRHWSLVVPESSDPDLSRHLRHLAQPCRIVTEWRPPDKGADDNDVPRPPSVEVVDIRSRDDPRGVRVFRQTECLLGTEFVPAGIIEPVSTEEPPLGAFGDWD